MRERPILFSGPMVRAILSGEKTVTRRVMKPQPKAVHADDERGGHWWPSKEHQSMLHIEEEMQKWTGLAGHACPYGQPGDRLWVRETHFINDFRGANVPEDDRAGAEIVYRADPLPCWEGEESEIPWRPSIHMPRWASRILLEITAVRVERVQDISDEQALAEGVDQTNTSIPGYARQRFHDLWESINGTGSWDANPWVWVVEFKRITP